MSKRKVHYLVNGMVACGVGRVSCATEDDGHVTCDRCWTSDALTPERFKGEKRPKRIAPPLPRAVRELLRDVVLRRAWYAGAINDCPASSEEMANRAAKLLGTTREDIVKRAKRS